MDRAARRPRLHRRDRRRGRRERRLHAPRAHRRVGADAAPLALDPARSSRGAPRCSRRASRRCATPRPAGRGRHRRVVERDRRAVERHPLRSAVRSGARHHPLPPRRARGREGHRGLRDVLREGLPIRAGAERAAADPRRRAALEDAPTSRAPKATARSSTGSRPATCPRSPKRSAPARRSCAACSSTPPRTTSSCASSRPGT